MSTVHKILLVEDDPAQVELLRRMLGEAQQNTSSFVYTLAPVNSVTAAVEKLRQETSEVILFSAQLPEPETITSIQQFLQVAPATTVIVLDHNKNGDRLIQAGAQDYLSWKELTGGLLLRSVRCALERSRIARVISAKEQFAQSTLDALASNLAILDENGIIIAVNRAWREFAQANGLVPELVSEGANYLEVCDSATGEYSEEAASVAAGIRAVIAREKETFGLEYPCHAPNEHRWFNCLVTRFYENEQVRVVVKHENITERVRAEAQVEERHAILATTLESTDNPIFSLDRSYRYTSFNRAHALVMKALYNVKIEIGKRLDEYQTIAEDWQYARHNLDRALSGETFVESAYSGSTDTQRRYFEVLHNPIRHVNGDVIGVSVFAQDISERKQVEDNLRRQNDYLKALQETTLELLSQLDLNMLLENIVRRAGQLMGTTSGYLDLIDPQTDELKPRVGIGLLAESIKHQVSLGEGVAGTVWQTRQPVVVNDYDHWGSRIVKYSTGVLSTVVGVPLFFNGQFLGVLGLGRDYSTQQVFTTGEVEILIQFAHLAAIAIENARLYTSAQQELAERKRAETQMHLGNAALEAAANAIVITNRVGVIEWANPAFSRLTGYTLPEIVGRNPGELLRSGKQEEAFYRNLWETILAGNIWQGEIINRRKDGTLYTEEMTITPIVDAQGLIEHFIAVKQDISTRKLAEAELEKRATQLALINTIGQKIVSQLDLQGVLDETVLQTQAAFGYYHVSLFTLDERKMELVMRSQAGRFSILFPSEHRIQLGSGMVGWAAKSGVMQWANDVQSHPRYQNLFPTLLPTASELSLPLKIGDRVLGVLDVQSPQANAFTEIDVTVLETLAGQAAIAIQNAHSYEAAQIELAERKQAEAALRETESRYRSLFEDSPISLWEEDFSAVKQHLEALRQEGVTDFRTYFAEHPETVAECMQMVKVFDVNNTTLTMHRAASKAVLLRDLRVVLGGDLQQFSDELVSIANGELKFSWEGTNCTLDGQQLDVGLNWAVLPGHEETLSKVIVSVVDITDRKRAERELLDYQSHLEETIKQRTTALLNAKNEAEAANRAKSDFLAMMSHEIRTPLNGILGLTHLILQTTLNEKQREYLTRLQASGDSLLAIINDILDFSKIESGNLTIEATNFNLDDVFHNLSGLVAYRAQEKGLELVFNVAPDIPRHLIGDPLRLGQILLNLVGNAIKFTEKGDVVVKVGVKKLSAQQATLEFAVCDTGIGLTDGQIARLFQPFIQADSSTTRKYGGTGLGLAISQRLAHLMNGQISVQSQPAQGTTFAFVAQFGRQFGRANLVFDTAKELKGLRVLVMDNHLATAEFLHNALEAFTFDVESASSSVDGLALLEKQSRLAPYRLILINHNPARGMNGLDIIRHIRQTLSLVNTPVILLLSATDMLQQAQTFSPDGYLVKPITRSQLFDTIMRVLGHQTRPRNRSNNISEGAALSQLRNRRILLVEDNEINQIVATNMLENLGVQVSVANSGEEGVEMTLNGNFDAVLMDIQMPGMDGYQATAKIRCDLRFTSEKLPVIAMTAHALTGEREKALAAGLNDYLSKPVDFSILVQTLLRWIPITNTFADSLKQPPVQPGSSLPNLPDAILTCLDTSTALARLGGNLVLYRRLLIMFKREHAEDLRHIRLALQNDDFLLARRLAHTLKGVAGTLGANSLVETAKNLEKELCDGGKLPTDAELELAENLLTVVISAIDHLETSTMLSQQLSDNPSSDALANQLDKLLALLTENDTAAVALLESILAQKVAPDLREDLLILREFVLRYDFVSALKNLRILAQRWQMLLNQQP